MKTYSKIFFAVIAAAFGLASCAQEELAPTEKPQGNLVTVHFGAESDIIGTKATLTTEDEDTFKSAWENGDVLGVEYSYEYGNTTATTAEWKGTSFESQLVGGTGAWMYDAVYPAPTSDNKADFGSSRKQNGNLYNSKYDFMYGSATAENAEAGKTSDGEDIVFNMNRQTAIAYFHLTGTLDEYVVSAKLSVEGDIACLATLSAELVEYSKGYKFDESESNALKEITITFDDGTEPKASDFSLWFNVLPTIYSKMTLTVETSGHTLTISKTAKDEDDGTYEAGKLYKVVKEIPAEKWVAKTTPTEPLELTFDFKTFPDGWPNGKANSLAGTYKYVLGGVEYEFTHTKDGDGIYCSGTSMSSGYLMICGKSVENSLGLPALKGYRLIKVVGTPASGASKKTEVSITDGTIVVNGGDSQIWDYSDTSTFTYDLVDTEENTVYYLSVSAANCQLVNLTLTYEPADPSATKYRIVCSETEGGTLAASSTKAVEGTEITLTATPAEGYEFNNDWTVKGADNSEITVTDGKFTMPAMDVTVSGTFKKISYTITKETAENGTFTVKIGDAEVETATKGEKVTLEATPAEGYEFDSWTVINQNTQKSIYVNGNSFTMPAANVSVSANFLQATVVPVYNSLAELVADVPTSEGILVTVTLTNEEITRIYKQGTNIKGLFFNVNGREIEIFSNTAAPGTWEVGGFVSGTLTNCKWFLYNNSTWELMPDNFNELTYTAPLKSCDSPVITLDGAVATITCATDGATIHYTVGESPADPTESDAVYSSPVTLADGQTIKALAVKDGMKPSVVASKKYTAGSPDVIVLWEDDFSSVTGSSGATVSSLKGSLSGFTDSYILTKAFVGDNAGELRFGSSSAIGSIQTPALTTIEGTKTIVVTFRAKKYSSDSTKIAISATTGTVSSQTVSPTADYVEYSVTVTGATSETKITLASNVKSKNRFYLNYIKLVSE